MENLNKKTTLFFDVVDGEANATVSIGKDKDDVIIPDTYEGLPVTKVTFLRHSKQRIFIKDLVFGNNVNQVKFLKAKDFPKDEYDYGIDFCIDTITVPDSLVKLPKYFLSKLRCNTLYFVNDTHPTYKIIDNVLINKKRGSLIRFLDPRNVIIPENDEIKIISKMCTANLGMFFEFYIPKNIETIEIDYFKLGSRITGISKDNKNFIFKDNGIIIEPKSKILLKYNGNSNVLDLYDEDIIKIAPDVFSDNKDLKEIILPSNLQVIGRNAFEGCSNLVSVKFNEALSEIHECAFRYCSSLKKAIFKSKTLFMYSNIFIGCTSLKHISYPKYVTTSNPYSMGDNYDVLPYPERCKLPIINPWTKMALVLTSDHYNEINLNKNCVKLDLFTNGDKQIVVDKLIIDADIAYFGMSGRIDVKEIIITEKAKGHYKLIGNSLINDNGLFINAHIDKESKEYRFPKEVKTIASYCDKLFTGADEIETLILPKEVERISLYMDEFYVPALIDCKNLVIENPNIDLDFLFDNMLNENTKYEKLIIDVTNSDKYRKEGNFLIDKKTNNKIAPLDVLLYEESL